MHRLLTRPVPTNKTRTHAHCTLLGLQGIQQTPLTSTTAVRMQAEGAATTEARPEARISGPDMTGIAIRQLMPLVHGTRAASLHRHSPWHSLLDKGQQDDRPRAILLTGSSQRTRPYFGRSETASLRRHRAKLQQIADCRLQISGVGGSLLSQYVLSLYIYTIFYYIFTRIF